VTADIEITSATVWDDKQVERWALLGNSTRKVTAVFGCRQQQIIGHGRAPDDVPVVTDEEIVRHSAAARSVGVEFLYLLNGRCDHLQVEAPKVRDQLIADIDWIVQCVRASTVVVADRRVAHLVRSRYSRETLGIRVSTIAAVMKPEDLEPWLPLDIDGVVLHHDAARDFDLLRHFAATLKAEAPETHLELLLNESCLHGCASRDAHYARLARASLGYIEGFQQNCNLPKFQDPSLVLSANWIRPEDVTFYRGLGIRRFKVAGREMSGTWLDRAIRAYVAGAYHANLVDLLTMTPPGLGVQAADVFLLDNRYLSDFLERLCTWQGPRRAFYRDLAAELWHRGALRVDDPGAQYEATRGTPRCAQPGQHHDTLFGLRAVADPAYGNRRRDSEGLVNISASRSSLRSTLSERG
jgi:collagenase-like PrtC family protease